MMRSSLLGLGLIAVALMGCVIGNGKIRAGPEGAAQAMAIASGPAWTINGAIPDPDGTAEFGCPHGGTIAVVFTASPAPESMTYTSEYRDCSTDGKSRLSGAMSTTTTFLPATREAMIAMRMVGEFNISGAITDFLRVDVTQTVTASTKKNAPENTSPVVRILMDGWIETSSGHYDYAAETVEADLTAELPQGQG